jgi:CDP-glucose 4,6-dehydratase
MLEFFNGKRIFITGHTGFKGSWLSKMLSDAGANLTGYSLAPHNQDLFPMIENKLQMTSVIGDIRDLDKLKRAFNHAKPEIVILLAAMAIVRDSYNLPHYTYETNVMGTVNILECIRQSETVKSALNVTTDKVYYNNEWDWGYRENDPLNGFDPYSNSKSCSDIITQSYIQSFLNSTDKRVSIVRAGNVIGGGDFSTDRIIPDCVRSTMQKKPIIVRNPFSVRPYQYVLEPLSAYLKILERQFNDSNLSGIYNIGPRDEDCITTGKLVQLFCDHWGDNANWISKGENGPHEAKWLKLDCSRIRNKIGWFPKYSINDAIEKSVSWTKSYLSGDDVSVVMHNQIKEYF